MSLRERTIFAAYYRPERRVYWLIAEADDKKNVVACFLVGNEYGGWGTVDLKAMREKGAMQLIPWKACNLPEAIGRIREHLRSTSTQSHMEPFL